MNNDMLIVPMTAPLSEETQELDQSNDYRVICLAAHVAGLTDDERNEKLRLLLWLANGGRR